MSNTPPKLTTPSQLKQTIDDMVYDITAVIDACTPNQYTWTNGGTLSSIGDHIRHTIEFLIELNNSHDTGIVDYDARKRDNTIATNQDHAKNILQEEALKLQETLKTKDLGQETITTQDSMTLKSTFGKEVANLPSHTTHHLAVIKPLLEQQNIQCNKDMGVAPATLKHKESNALNVPTQQRQIS
ncbi:MAG: hypothetical protein ACPG05_02105 [Bdellovibrionales bacterium]